MHWLTWATGSVVLAALIALNTNQPFFPLADEFGYPVRFRYYLPINEAAMNGAVFGTGPAPEPTIAFSHEALAANCAFMAAVLFGSMYAAHRCKWKPKLSFSLRSTLILVTGLCTVVAVVNQRVRSWEYLAVEICEGIALAAVFEAWYSLLDISDRLLRRPRKPEQSTPL